MDRARFYASLLIRHGESVKAVQSRLGHASAVETLDTYGHLWPDSEDRTRAAVDAVFSEAAGANEARSLAVGPGRFMRDDHCQPQAPLSPIVGGL